MTATELPPSLPSSSSVTSSASSLPSLSVPDLTPPLSPDSYWLLDLFLLPHTALRLELRDAFRALDALTTPTPPPASDLAIFFAWWRGFAAFVHDVHDIQERVLAPWAARHGIPRERLETHVGALLEMNAVANVELSVGKAPFDIVVRKAAVGVERFAKMIGAVMAAKETELVAELRKAAPDGEDDRAKVESEYWKAVAKTKGSSVFMFLRGLLWAANHENKKDSNAAARTAKLRCRIAGLRVTAVMRPRKKSLRKLLKHRASTGKEGGEDDEDVDEVEENLLFSAKRLVEW